MVVIFRIQVDVHMYFLGEEQERKCNVVVKYDVVVVVVVMVKYDVKNDGDWMKSIFVRP